MTRIMDADNLLLGREVNDGFKYKIIVDTTMSIDKIVDTINNVQDGTVIYFNKGTYNFKDKKFLLKNKKNIELTGYANQAKDTVFNNFNFGSIDSTNINLGLLTISEASYITFGNSKNIRLNAINLKSTQIAITKKSKAIISNITSHDSYKYSPIYISNSIVKADKLDISNDKANCIGVFKNSEVFIYNSKFSNRKYASIYSTNSKIKSLAAKIWQKSKEEIIKFK